MGDLKTEILIVGAGLAGLRLGTALQAAGRDFVIVEARDRVGGRILSHGPAGLDLGPSWFWPGQPRIAALLHELGLEVFQQYAEGKLVFQDGSGAIRRDLDMAPMAGSYRLVGGLGRLTKALAEKLTSDTLRLGQRVVSLEQTPDHIKAVLQAGSDTRIICADKVVLALPPRVIGETISLTPTLPDAATRVLRNVPTWMAGHAKAIAVYSTPFWRGHGLSGDAISHAGPLAEIHDASPANGSIGALFGFVGISAPQRRAMGPDALKQAIVSQLGDLFGSEAAHHTEILIQDWAVDPLTATALDETPPAGHPAYGMPPALRDLWDCKLTLASTEMGAEFGGFLEGALEAADHAALMYVPAAVRN